MSDNTHKHKKDEKTGRSMRPLTFNKANSRSVDSSVAGASETPSPDQSRTEVQLYSSPNNEEIKPTTGPSNASKDHADEKADETERNLGKMQGAVRTLLECIGEDPNREGLLATPSRYAKALMFLTKGYAMDLDQLVNGALFREGYHEMVIVKDIEIHSLCEHHLVPFSGKMHIGYIPSDTVIGLSKLPRIAEMYSRRLQIQERLTQEVANAIMDVLKPQGVAVVMESSHLCMVMRGVEKTSTTTVTSCDLGCFKKPKTKREFLSLLGVNRA